MDNGIVLVDYDNTQSFTLVFIMIMKFVLVKENVTDFCYVLEFMDITGSCTVFGHLVGPFIIISSKTRMLQIIKRLEDKLFSSKNTTITFKS